MVWLLNQHDYRIFNRNPLVAVSIEIKFHPILKIGSGQAIPDFQDKIRSSFPDYKEGKVQVVNLGVDGNPVKVREEKQFVFIHNESQTQLTLTATSMLLVCHSHIKGEETSSKFEHALKVLLMVCGEINPIRLGVRYINQIQKNKISEEIGKNVEWEDLIKNDFLNMPANIADLSNTSYLMELNSSLEQGGITLRYGLLKESPEDELMFRFDVDRYLAETFDIADARNLINGFIYDIYCLFTEMRNDALEEWMSM